MCNITDGYSFNTSSINGTFNINNNGSNTSKHYAENNLLSQCLYWSIVLKVYPYRKFMTCSLAVVTNILVVATILSSYKLWNYSTGLLLLTLGCVDIFGCLIQIMVTSIDYYFHFPGYGTLILVMVYFLFTQSNISNFMMLLISLNRYALVCTPLSHYRITSRKSVIAQILTISTILLCFKGTHTVSKKLR